MSSPSTVRPLTRLGVICAIEQMATKSSSVRIPASRNAGDTVQTVVGPTQSESVGPVSFKDLFGDGKKVPWQKQQEAERTSFLLNAGRLAANCGLDLDEGIKVQSGHPFELSQVHVT